MNLEGIPKLKKKARKGDITCGGLISYVGREENKQTKIKNKKEIGKYRNVIV